MAWELTGYLGKDLAGARLGLVGFGGIGQAVAARAVAFGMQVHHHARRPTGRPGYVSDLDTLLSDSDVVSIHVPLSPDTRGLLSAERISRMPRGSVLVNTARGGIVDEDALADALTSGHLARSGTRRLRRRAERQPATPGRAEAHAPARTSEAPRGRHGKAMTQLACQGVVDVLAGRTPANLVTTA